jgi:hypothetical protein
VPNRYVDYFRFGSSTFYGGNSYVSPTSALATPNVAFASHATVNFIVAFGNPNTLAGAFTATLNFTEGCSIIVPLWNGTTPTPTNTRTPTRTPTLTPVPLVANLSESYSRLLFRGPDFGMHSQSLQVTVGGDLGGSYIVVLHIRGPNSYDINLPTLPIGTYTVDAASTGNQYFGCSDKGYWWAWFEVTGLSGRTKTSNTVVWGVGFPEVHGSS